MVEAIKTTVVDIPWEEFFGKQVIPIHKDAKYVIVCGDEVDLDEVEGIGRFLGQWFEDPISHFALLIGDYMLVRVDKLPPNVKDRLGISDEP